MPRRTLWIERPGSDGVVTDLPAHQLPLRALERGADAIMPQGLIRQRRGWRYDGTTADVADNLVAVARNKFVLAGVTRTVTGDDDGDLFIHNSASAGTALFAGSVVYLPRAVYNDELLWCAQDGLTPMRRYAGAASAGTASDLTGTTTDGEATIRDVVFSVPPDVGAFVYPSAKFHSSKKIVAATTSVLTLEALRSSSASVVTIAPSLTGVSAPVVSIYDAGTVTTSGSTVTGYGTKWNSDISILTTQPERDCLLIIPFGGSPNPKCSEINAVGSDTSITWDTNYSPNLTTKSSYSIVRKCPFKDVASHKDSLWGTGVAQHKSRVYVGPQGWNIGTYPGFALPSTEPVNESENHLDFLMDFIDVPSPNDADECVALLPSENPLIVLKRRNAYGIYGVYGALDQAMLPGGEGAGCLDIRSAHTLSIGPVWGGSEDVWVYAGGRVRGLTAGKVTREWQQMAAAFDPATDRCVIGEKDGVLVVYLSVGNGGTKRCWYVYPFDEGGRFNPRWLGPISNHEPRYMFSSRVAGEADRILAVQDLDQGRVLDYGPALDGTGPARDDDGTSPVLEMNGSARLAREAGADVDERLLEVAIEANLYDTGGSGSTLGGLVSSKQALDSDAEIVTNLSSMASKNADLTKPYVHDVGAKAALHQVRLTKTATQTTEQKTEITRIGLTLRRSRRPL